MGSAVPRSERPVSFEGALRYAPAEVIDCWVEQRQYRPQPWHDLWMVVATIFEHVHPEFPAIPLIRRSEKKEDREETVADVANLKRSVCRFRLHGADNRPVRISLCFLSVQQILVSRCPAKAVGQALRVCKKM